MLKRARETGDITPNIHLRGRKPSYSAAAVASIKGVIDEQCDITAGEIKERLGLELCESSIRTMIREKLGYRYKKMVPASERERPDVAAKREAWGDLIHEIPLENLIFLDESGANTNMSRRYAWVFGGKRAVDAVPLRAYLESFRARHFGEFYCLFVLLNRRRLLFFTCLPTALTSI